MMLFRQITFSYDHSEEKRSTSIWIEGQKRRITWKDKWLIRNLFFIFFFCLTKKKKWKLRSTFDKVLIWEMENQRETHLVVLHGILRSFLSSALFFSPWSIGNKCLSFIFMDTTKCFFFCLISCRQFDRRTNFFYDQYSKSLSYSVYFVLNRPSWVSLVDSNNEETTISVYPNETRKIYGAFLYSLKTLKI